MGEQSAKKEEKKMKGGHPHLNEVHREEARHRLGKRKRRE